MKRNEMPTGYPSNSLETAASERSWHRCTPKGDRHRSVRIALLGLAGLLGSPGLRAQDTRPPALRDVGIDQNLDARIPLDAHFRDETGNTVPLGRYFGKRPVILSFAYYECPMLCTLILNGLVKCLKAVALEPGKEFEIVNVSINPKETSELAAAKKRHYVQDYGRTGSADGWHFLTGDEDQIRLLTRAAGYRYTYDAATGQFAHASGILVVTPEGRIARYFYGIEYSARDMRLGLVEAAVEKIGSPVDQLLLYCFHYDPVTGRYGLVIMNIVRVLGTVTVLAIGTFIFVQLRRERHPAAARREGKQA